MTTEVLFILGAAILIASIVRIDAFLVGPYFAMSELIPGFPGFDAPLFSKPTSLRWAVARRLLYPFLCGVIFALAGAELETVALVVGLGAFLLIWPGLFMNVPLGVSRRDWRYAVLYISVIVTFTGLSILGHLTIGLVGFAADGDIWGYLADQAIGGILGIICSIVGSAFLKGTFTSLKERAEHRVSDSMQTDEED